MMKVYEEKGKSDAVFLRLRQADDEIRLYLCDDEGGSLDRGGVLVIRKGRITMLANIHPNLGFVLDPEGHVVVEFR